MLALAEKSKWELYLVPDESLHARNKKIITWNCHDHNFVIDSSVVLCDYYSFSHRNRDMNQMLNCKMTIIIWIISTTVASGRVILWH